MVSLESWASGEGIDFVDGDAEAQYRERADRMLTVLERDAPDRTPVHILADFLAGHFADVSFEEMMYDPEKSADAYRQFLDRFDPDFNPVFPVAPGRMGDVLGYTVYDWPGDGLGPDHAFQANEGEYMREDEYEELIEDPTKFMLRKWYPRAFESLEAFEQFPLTTYATELTLLPFGMGVFGTEPMQEALDALKEAGESILQWQQSVGAVQMEGNMRGYPSTAGGMGKAPFDVVGDTLRGTRDIMIDMRKRPEQVKAAAEALVPEMAQMAIEGPKQSGVPFTMFVLHKGADSFMSEADYREFYWPTLKQVMEAVIDEGIVPWMFAEGSYEDRLDLIAEDQPDGKVVWHFDQTDLGLAKEKIGDVATIAGNVPTALIKTSDPETVREYCEEQIEIAGPDGFLLTPGATVYRGPEENLQAIIDAAKNA
ncbi:MAG: uroporphyrinogen decarboxylase family protein [Halodesulfurarchaeum sp.]